VKRITDQTATENHVVYSVRHPCRFNYRYQTWQELKSLFLLHLWALCWRTYGRRKTL